MKGMLRVHQFDKLEMESFTLPEDSAKEQDFIVAVQEYMVQELGLPYQVVAICTGDMVRPIHVKLILRPGCRDRIIPRNTILRFNDRFSI